MGTEPLSFFFVNTLQLFCSRAHSQNLLDLKISLPFYCRKPQTKSLFLDRYTESTETTPRRVFAALPRCWVRCAFSKEMSQALYECPLCGFSVAGSGQGKASARRFSIQQTKQRFIF